MNGPSIQCKNFGSRLFRFVAKHAFDRWTDRKVTTSCVWHAFAVAWENTDK